jgi:outer membrane receptor protein involved in Fe transport
MFSPARDKMRCMRVAWLIRLSFVVLFSFYTASVARGEGNADEAELHFQIGLEAFQKQDYRSALEHFLASNRLVPNRNVVYNIARAYERLGRYIEAYRYYSDAKTGESDASVIQKLDASLAQIAPKVALIRVESNPPGATIYLGRKDLGSHGKTPRTLAVAAGKLKVLAELDGHEPAREVEVDAVVGREAVIRFALVRIEGLVKVTVEGAPKAEVRIGDEAGAPACVAPCELRLAPGTHLLYFAAEGYQAPPRQVFVRPREVTRATAKMSALRGTVVVEADERGAVVEIDGRAMGFTPAVIQNVAVGRRQVVVRARGYQPLEKEVDVQPNRQIELLNLRLVPIREVQAVSRIAQNIDLAPSSVSIIAGEELRAFGYPTVASALFGTRGVYLSNDHTYVSAGIRGIGEPNDYGNRLLVLRDGLSMNDNLLNSSYIGSDLRPDLANIERIEIVRGPGSLLYGTGAFSGVVNLVPRNKTEPSQVFAGAGTYDNAVARAMGGFHYNFNDSAGIWASVGGARSDGYGLPVKLIDPKTGPAVQTASATDSFHSVRSEGRAWWRDVTAQWSYHQRKQFIPVGALNTRFDDPRTFYFDERAAGEVRYEPKFGRVNLYTRAHAHHYHFEGLYLLPTTTNGPFGLREKYLGSWFGGEARARVKILDRFHLTLGGEAQFHPKADLRGTTVDETFEATADGGYLDEHRPFNFGAAYLVVDAKPTAWFGIDAGVRVDVYSTFGPIVVPRGALIFQPTKGGVLKLMGGRAFRAPSVYEQYYSDGGESQTVAVDPARGLSLGPESIYSGEVEYLQRFLDDWVALGAFHTSYIHGIINTVVDRPATQTTSAAIRYANSDSPALAIGGDVELRREWRRGWMLSGFYSYQRAQYLNDPDPAVRENPRLVNAPEHLAGFRAVVPVVEEIAKLGVRGALEAPRRISLDTNDVTKPAFIVDTVVSGDIRRFGVHYVVGIYNLLDFQGYGAPTGQPMGGPPMGQPQGYGPPMGQPPMGQPPMGQPPMGQPGAPPGMPQGGPQFGLGFSPGGGVRVNFSGGQFSPQALMAGVMSDRGFESPRALGLPMLGLGILMLVANFVLIYVVHYYFPYFLPVGGILAMGGGWLVITGEPASRPDGSPAPMWGRAGLGACLLVGLLIGVGLIFAVHS